MKNLVTYLKLLRVQNLGIIVATLYVIRIFVYKPYFEVCGYLPFISDVFFLMLVFAVVLMAAAGYVINDYFDQTIDGINKPEKQIVGTLIQPKNAQNLFYILAGLSSVLGIIIAWKSGFLNLAFIFFITATMLWYYSYKYKRIFLWGNIVVAFFSGFVIITYWLFEFFAMKHSVYGFVDCQMTFKSITNISIIYFTFAFLISLIREIVKDVQDIEGDKLANRQTLPIRLGIPKTKQVLMALIVVFLLFASWIQYLIFLADKMWLSVYSFVMISIPLIYALTKLISAKEKDDYKFLSGLLKIIMLLGIVLLVIHRYIIL